MNWMEDNWVNILAIVGAAYGLIRTIVALTPTKKDDKWLARNKPIIQKIAKLLGLDLNQGRKIKS